jgi:Type II secretion system (T2SS), protein E, N-terminal domain
MRRTMEAATHQASSLRRAEPALATLVQRANLVQADRLEQAVAESEATGKRLPRVLLERGWVDQAELARFLADQRGMPFLALEDRKLDLTAAHLLPEEVARLNRAVPVGFRGDAVVVVIEDPTDDNAAGAVKAALGRDALFGVAAHDEIATTIDTAYARAPEPVAEPEQAAPFPDAVPSELSPVRSPASAVFEVVVHLTSGEGVVVDAFADDGDAWNEARAVMRILGAADADWPFVGGRFLRPDLVVSVDVVERAVRRPGPAAA